ncbi:MAG: DUF896 domain-containing protein [Firmicutes bacterium]|nr:DUF896 domain-containing protein [Bacillota bacterium]MBQ1888332.1 DUF896 domain-containing protein [Bacillota bacterium]MBQ2455828.1 DUF896 domain-containing protein [Bacillota bacterium]MBQ3578704.1 DUF896 domain-containing protein [Bacillota bacterium]MBQ5436132.1 DUF896 domain-containing protein [Bacillota bacterium]
MLKSEIDRINELAHKSKLEGLTDEEKAEQAELRRRFLDDFRAAFKQQLDSIELVDPDDPRLKNRKKGS